MSLSVHIRKKLKTGTLDVSFESEDGILAILGETGSGKTAALRCIAGLDRPDEGSIVLDGKPLFDSLHGVNLAAKRRGIGYLSAEGVLHPRRTVEQNLRRALSLAAKREGRSAWDSGVGRRKRLRAGQRKLAVTQRIPQILAEYELDGFGGSYPRELSRTQYLMASLACVMAGKPRLLLLDEPFADLDPFERAKMLRKLRDKIVQPAAPVGPGSAAKGSMSGAVVAGKKPGGNVTIPGTAGGEEAFAQLPHQAVFASSDAEEVYAMSSHVMVMSQGVSQPAREKEDFFTSPVTVSAALLSGCSNVTKASALDAFHAFAPEWGSVFLFREEGEFHPVPPRLQCVGIREHSFRRLVPEGETEGDYFRFTVHIVRIEDTLTEWRIWFRTGSSAKGELLWQIPKSEISREEIHAVKRLFVADKDIMRLI